jgi:hypothetical protein
MANRYTVNVFFDPEAEVWVALGATIFGLATEAPTLEAVKQHVWEVAPELLEANHGLTGPFTEDILEFRMLPGPPED